MFSTIWELDNNRFKFLRDGEILSTFSQAEGWCTILRHFVKIGLQNVGESPSLRSLKFTEVSWACHSHYHCRALIFRAIALLFYNSVPGTLVLS